MGKTKVEKPAPPSAAASAKDALAALNILFGGDPGEISSITGFTPFFQQLAEQQAGIQLDLAEQTFGKALDLSKQGLEFIQDDPILSQFVSTDVDDAILSPIRDRISSELAVRGLEGSPIAAAEVGSRLGIAFEGLRNQRLNQARSIIGGLLPGSSLFQTPVVPGVPGQEGVSLGQQIGIAGQTGIAGFQGFTDINAANAQFEQQFKQDIGKLIGFGFGGGFGGF
jgi:hypothetical protein